MTELDSDLLTNIPNYGDQIQHVHTQPRETPDHRPAERVLNDDIASKLPHDLYTHQSSALSELQQDENVCVATSTSSGKTLVYGLHIAQKYMENPNSRALIVYPTKALSRDQQQALTELYEQLELDIDVAVYDGDTSQSKRQRIKKNANVIITNFAGINAYIPYHTGWGNFFSNIDIVAIDESHSYTGVEGMHVAWIIRRLKRIIKHYDSEAQYILTSATIGNPAEHSSELIGEPVVVIDNDGSPHGKRDVIFWNPPKLDSPDGFNTRRSSLKESADVTAFLMEHGIQSLTFVRSRKQTELLARTVRGMFEDEDDEFHVSDADIKSYHAGHGKESRRETEEWLKNGELDGVASTNALELGIDVGGVDATVLTGYPGTRQSFWQQLGRSGRGGDDSVGVVIGDHDSINQYIMNNPDFLTEDAVEDAVIDTENNQVYAQHILCAAHEITLTEDDIGILGDRDRLEKVIEMWNRAGRLRGDLESGVMYQGATRPQEDINLYGTSDEQFEVRLHPDDDAELDMEPIDKERAYRDFHRGAVYLHRGKRFIVDQFIERGSQRQIVLKSADNVDYYTRTQSETRIQDVYAQEEKEMNGFTVKWGTGDVVVHHRYYQKINIDNGNTKEMNIPTGLSPLHMETQMMWIEVPKDVETQLVWDYHRYESDHKEDSPYEGYMGGLHALEHGIISVAPLQLRMDKRNLGGLSTLRSQGLETSGIFIYDGIVGGIGLSKAVFENIDLLLEKTQRLIETCDCGRINGCPACVMSDSCGSGNSPLHTEAAVDVIELLNGKELDENEDRMPPTGRPQMRLS